MGRLFLYVPPLGGQLASWNALRDRLAQEPECADDEFQHWPPRPRDHVGIWTLGRIDRHASSLAARLAESDEAATARGRPYDEIILLGSSVGALLVRWAWLAGMGAFTGDQPATWAVKVRRIVLFGGLNRGYSTRREQGRGSFRLLVTKLLISLASPIRFAWQDALAGSAFVTNVRLTWMRYLAEHPDRQPEIVQLLGTEDDLVSREDSRDIEQFPRAAHVLIPGAAHFVLDTSGPTGEDRYLVLRSHILHETTPTTPPPAPQAAATDVVFVVHGIRAGAYGWVTDIRRLLADTGPGWRVVTPTYRYFSALAFAFPATRRRKVRWFLDQYGRELAGHPTASFHFVGHSNGTYLLGQALRQVPAVRFERVYLAGSVLPGDYPWHAQLDAQGAAQPRIAVIRSDRGNRDLPVAVLAQGLRGLRMRDVGDGGFGGFAQLDAAPAIQWPYFPGGHAAPLSTPDRRQDIVRYITTGTAVEPDGLIDTAGGALALVSRLSPVLLVIATVLAAAAIGWALLAPGIASVSAAILVVLALIALAVA